MSDHQEQGSMKRSPVEWDGGSSRATGTGTWLAALAPLLELRPPVPREGAYLPAKA